MTKIRVVELFSGIGAQAEALKELGLDYEVVATSDIDKHAIMGYEAIHGPVNNLGDITKIEHLPECDLLTYSYPCTSISLAGKREGMKEGSGTASSLLWEVGRLLVDMNKRGCLPEVLLMENVDAVLNRDNIGEFKRWLGVLGEMGYISSYTIMNAKDYGTPQNRRRIFCVSTLAMGEFIFPEPCPDGRVLRDVLEKDVPESYFLSEKRLATFKRHKERNDAKGNGFSFKIHELVDYEKEKKKGDVAQSVTNNADRYCSTWIGIPEDEIKTDDRSSDCKNTLKIETVGEMSDCKFTTDKNVLNTDGVSAVIRAKGMVNTPKIEVAGKLNIDGWHNQVQEVYDVSGTSPCLQAQCNNAKIKILAENDIIYAGELGDSEFGESKKVMSDKGISRTITAEHQGPNSPKVVIEKSADLIVMGNVESNYDMEGRIYSPEGGGPTVRSAGPDKVGITDGDSREDI